MWHQTWLAAVLAFVTSLAGATASAGPIFSAGLYATAWDRDEVIRIGPDGSWQTALSVMNQPAGLAFLNGSTLYVTGTGPGWPRPYGELKVYGADGGVLRSVDPIPASGGFSNGTTPWGLALDADGTAYVATHNAPSASKVSPSGVVSDWTGYQYDLFWGKDAALAPNGDLYMTHGLAALDSKSRVVKIDKTTGAVTTVIDHLDYTSGIAFDAAGNFYLSHDRLGTVSKVAAGTTSPLTLTSLTNPFFSTLGPDGRLFVISRGDSRDQVWAVDTATGAKSLYADDLPGNLRDLAFAPVQAVPEPGTLTLLGIGGVGMAFGAWRRKKAGVQAT